MMRKMLAAAVAAFAAARLAAVTVGPDWCVAYPDGADKDVNRVLRIAAEEIRDDLNASTGLKLRAVAASKAKAPAIWIGAESAKKAGFDLSGLKWYDNVLAEKGGSIYLFGNDRTGRDPGKFGRVDWFRCVVPSVKAATRFLETYAGVRFLMPGEVGKEVPKRETNESFTLWGTSLLASSSFGSNDAASAIILSWILSPLSSVTLRAPVEISANTSP